MDVDGEKIEINLNNLYYINHSIWLINGYHIIINDEDNLLLIYNYENKLVNKACIHNGILKDYFTEKSCNNISLRGTFKDTKKIYNFKIYNNSKISQLIQKENNEYNELKDNTCIVYKDNNIIKYITKYDDYTLINNILKNKIKYIFANSTNIIQIIGHYHTFIFKILDVEFKSVFVNNKLVYLDSDLFKYLEGKLFIDYDKSKLIQHNNNFYFSVTKNNTYSLLKLFKHTTFGYVLLNVTTLDYVYEHIKCVYFLDGSFGVYNMINNKLYLIRILLNGTIITYNDIDMIINIEHKNNFNINFEYISDNEYTLKYTYNTGFKRTVNVTNKYIQYIIDDNTTLTKINNLFVYKDKNVYIESSICNICDINNTLRFYDAKITLLNGDIITTNYFEKDLPFFGKYIYTNGTIYTGRIINYIPNGIGKYIYTDGSIYTGYSINNKYNGVGIFKGLTFSKSGYFINNELKVKLNILNLNIEDLVNNSITSKWEYGSVDQLYKLYINIDQ